MEREYARMLRVSQRDGSTLSMIVREGWDGHRLETRSRAKVTVASGYQLVVIGHITAEELQMVLSSSEAFNGWANRFLWVDVNRSKRLPDGGNVLDALAADYGRQIRDAMAASRTRGRMERTPAGPARWAQVYDELGNDDPAGLLGAVVARAEPMTARLSLLYAVLDGAPAIDVAHVDAAHALWRYSRATAGRIWGDALGDPAADRLLAALRSAKRLTGDDQHAALGRHTGRTEMARLRRVLVEAGQTTIETEATGGRPSEILVLSPCEESELSERTSDYSLNSHNSQGDNGSLRPRRPR